MQSPELQARMAALRAQIQAGKISVESLPTRDRQSLTKYIKELTPEPKKLGFRLPWQRRSPRIKNGASPSILGQTVDTQYGSTPTVRSHKSQK